METRRSIGGSFTDLCHCDGPPDDLSVDPASDNSTSIRRIKLLTMWKR
jgi:hypothetical protein